MFIFLSGVLVTLQRTIIIGLRPFSFGNLRYTRPLKEAVNQLSP